MKKIAIVSGKGGTGKTIITASFAALAKRKVMVDCDVDAADLHLILSPKIKEKHEFKGWKKALIDLDICTGCGICRDICRFEAIIPDPYFHIDSISCEGCGLCSFICPLNAITMKDNLAGEWYVSETRYGPMVHAKLGIAEENSGKLVTLVKMNAEMIAEKGDLDYLIIDGPPGIGCPVIATLSRADLALVVTEPTLPGIHDMERIIGVARHFGVRVSCVINKFDINLENSAKIENWCKSENILFLGKIPFDEIVTHSLVKKTPVVEYYEGEVSSKIRDIWNYLEKILG
ncbi:MAG: ATP-binding protein [Thermodesulfobacteriota bacterium]